MTKIFLITILLFLYHPQKIILHVIVKNIQKGKGDIDIAIYDNKANFFKKAFAEETLPANADSLEYSFYISTGEYAVEVYQDINKNKKLDKGIFSIPTEPYGLSNNFRPFLSAPTFDDCKFKATKSETIRIKLK